MMEVRAFSHDKWSNVEGYLLGDRFDQSHWGISDECGVWEVLGGPVKAVVRNRG